MTRNSDRFQSSSSTHLTRYYSITYYAPANYSRSIEFGAHIAYVESLVCAICPADRRLFGVRDGSEVSLD